MINQEKTFKLCFMWKSKLGTRSGPKGQKWAHRHTSVLLCYVFVGKSVLAAAEEQDRSPRCFLSRRGGCSGCGWWMRNQFRSRIEPSGPPGCRDKPAVGSPRQGEGLAVTVEWSLAQGPCSLGSFPCPAVPAI